MDDMEQLLFLFAFLLFSVTFLLFCVVISRVQSQFRGYRNRVSNNNVLFLPRWSVRSLMTLLLFLEPMAHSRWRHWQGRPPIFQWFYLIRSDPIRSDPIRFWVPTVQKKTPRAGHAISPQLSPAASCPRLAHSSPRRRLSLTHSHTHTPALVGNRPITAGLSPTHSPTLFRLLHQWYFQRQSPEIYYYYYYYYFDYYYYCNYYCNYF